MAIVGFPTLSLVEFLAKLGVKQSFEPGPRPTFFAGLVNPRPFRFSGHRIQNRKLIPGAGLSRAFAARTKAKNNDPFHSDQNNFDVLSRWPVPVRTTPALFTDTVLELSQEGGFLSRQGVER